MRTEYLLNRELEKVLMLLQPSNQLVLQVSLHTGLRVGDVLELKREQIKPRFWVTEKKTGKKKLVGLPEELREAILKQSGKIWCFQHRDDETKHRTRQAVWKDVKNVAKLLHIKKNVAPHSFRKVYAVDLLVKYGDIERVQKALNHSDVCVTMLYVYADKMLYADTLKKIYRAGQR